MEKGYRTVRGEGVDEFVEQRSRFIGCCCPVSTEEEAQAFIARRKKEFWDATHNVYAYVLRQGQIRRFSDDGEPQGTAGMPMLNLLLGEQVEDCCIVVTRYFGGTLLGTGGLVRAYSKGARLALEAAGRLDMCLCAFAHLRCSYAYYGKAMPLLASFGAVVENTDFGEEVKIFFYLPDARLEELEKALTEDSAGTLFIEEVEKRLFPYSVKGTG